MRTFISCVFALIAFPGVSQAQQSDVPLVDGEVIKIDTAAQKITLEHEPIPNLDMPSMKMVFRVTDPAMLEQVSVGEHIRFTADRVRGAITITSIAE